MTVGKLTKPYHGRRGAPSTIELRFWTDATKTVGRDMTAISTAWLAELRANPTDTSAAATFSIDASGAVGTTGVPGVLTLSLDATANTGLLLGRASRTLGWDLVALDTDTPVVTGTYVVDGAYTHPGSDASPTTSTPLGIYDVVVLGDATTTLLEVDVFSGPEGPTGPPGGVNSVQGRQGDVSLSDIFAPIDGSLNYVGTDAQTLTSGQKSQARTNLGLGATGSGVFSVQGAAPDGAGNVDLSSAFGAMPNTVEATVYVTKHGSDANNGLTWGNAKLTVGAAITALVALTGGTGAVEVGVGVFIENKVTRPPGCWLRGCGEALTTITLANGQNTNVIEDSVWGSTTALSDGGGVEKMSINGNKANQTLAPARAWASQTVNLSSSTPTTLYVNDVSLWTAASITTGNIWVGLDLCAFTGITAMGAYDPSNPTTTGGKFTGVTKVATGTKTYYPDALVTPGAQWGAGVAVQSSRTVMRDLVIYNCAGDARIYQGAGGSGSIAYENKGFNVRAQQCNGWELEIGPNAPDGMEHSNIGANCAFGSVLMLSQDWQFLSTHPSGVFSSGGTVSFNARNAPAMFVICASKFKMLGGLFDTPAYGALQINQAWTQQSIAGVYVRGADIQNGAWASSGAAAAISLYGQPDPGNLTLQDVDIELGVRSRFSRLINFQPTTETVMASGSYVTPASTDPTGSTMQVLNSQPFSGLGSAIAGTIQLTNTSTGAALDTISYKSRSSATAGVATAAAIGDTSLAVDDASAFAASGTVTIYPQSTATGAVTAYRVTYTGKTGNTLTGVPASSTGSITVALPVGAGVAQHYLSNVRSTGAGGVSVGDGSTAWQVGRAIGGISGRLHTDASFLTRPGSLTYPQTGATYKLLLTGRIVDNPNPFRGTVTIAVGQTSASVAHNLFTKPSQYRAAPMDGDPQQRWWVTADSTNVTVTLAAAAATSSVKFGVEAASTLA